MELIPKVAESPHQTPTLHRTDCCSLLLPLSFKVYQFQQETPLFSKEEKREILRVKNTLISHINHPCHSCIKSFNDLPVADRPTFSQPGGKIPFTFEPINTNLRAF